MTLTVRAPAFLNALVRVSRSVETRLRYRCSLLIHSPDSKVEWASQLPPPKVGEVSQPLRAPNPAAFRVAVPSSSTRPTPPAMAGGPTALPPQPPTQGKITSLPPGPPSNRAGGGGLE